MTRHTKVKVRNNTDTAIIQKNQNKYVTKFTPSFRNAITRVIAYFTFSRYKNNTNAEKFTVNFE